MYTWPPYMEELGDIVKKYIDDGNPLSISSNTGIYEKLENKFSEMIGRKYVLAVSSGTMALYSAFFAIGIQPGDEIICTSFSFHATISPAHYMGAKIVFCDVEPDTGLIDSSKIEELITDKTKAIVTNDQWGHPCDKDKIVDICRRNDVYYIEDCSHAHFSSYKGKYSGTFGDIACWSFQGSKLINGGEGGILATDNYEFFERAVLLGHYSWRSIRTVQSEKYKEIATTGFGLKLRMHPLAAVIILHELENYADKWVKSRNETLGYFERELEARTPIKAMVKRGYVSSMGAWYGFYPRIDYNLCPGGREDFVKYLKENNIEVKVPTNGILPYLPLYSFGECLCKQDKNLRYYGAETYEKSIIGFPTFSNYEYELINHYVDVIERYFG